MPTSQEYQQTVETIRKKYPPLTPHKFDIITGSNPTMFSEFYPAHERMNPRPGTHVIETFEKGRALQSPENIEGWLTGEMLHLLGTKDRNDKPYDPTFRALKEQFMSSFTEKQLDVERELHAKRGDKRPFEQAFEHSEADAFIRSYIFPSVNDPNYVKSLQPKQVKILDKIKDYVTSGAPDASGR